MIDIKHLTTPELEAGLDAIRRSPADAGAVEMIVRRPGVGEREVLTGGYLDLTDGLAGDSWGVREPANPDAQITLMNVRAVALIAQDRERWPLAGDQLYVDLDLSADNLPPGTQLAIGGAVLAVTAVPHTGCAQFRNRFGADALKFVNSQAGRQLNLRGINTRVVQPGAIRVGDVVRKVSSDA
jgi:MOSC domain-containing protein YiiM